MFVVMFLLHVLFGVALISLCLGAPVAIALLLVKSPYVMPELDQWWQSQQIQMLEGSTTRLAAELQVEELHETSTSDPQEIIIYPGRRNA